MSDTHTSETASAEAPPPGEAYIIVGWFSQGTTQKQPSIGVLIIPNSSDMPKAPDRRVLNRLGFHRVEFTERVKLVGEPLPHPSLYVFERAPSVKHVLIAQVARDGSLSGTIIQPGQPHSVIPEMSGQTVTRLITPRGALSGQDLVKPPVRAESRMQKRRAFSG